MAKSKSLIIGVLCVGIVVILLIVMAMRDNTQLLSAQEAQSLLTSEEVRDVSVDNDYIYFVVKDTPYKVYLYSLPPKLWSYELPINVKSAPIFGDILGEIGIVVLVLLVLSVLIQAVQSRKRILKIPQKQQNDIMRESEIPFTESSYMPMSSSVRFKDVAGISEVKEELVEIIDYLKNPKHYQDLGITLPKGVLLVGPPGVGKTMIAKAVAGEAAVPFFYQSGSSFVQIYVGMGAKRVRELFARAKARAPSIIFIDEIDAVGKARGNTRSDEREATLNQLLTEMDGFEDSSGVIVIAATNKMEVLDEALLRSGRFDRRIYVELPNLQEREHILGLYLKDKKHELDIEEVARLCVGFSGAALASLVNESALNALRRKSNVIQKEDILATKDKVLTGKKKALSLNEKEKEILALYQSAKALSAYWLEVDFDKIGLVSESFRQIDKELTSKQELMSKIKVALSGNIAVECIYKQTFSNAKEDILSAKEIATQMCEQYGMGERLLSDSSDIAHILEQAQKEMREFIINSKAVLLQISRALQERERLSKDEIQEIYESIHK
ncbi:AAA family ATPase [Helicobacter japonicus]|uniref:AAA family ATPase n=1 Tax=Helicobacter japonicus TaxID=425400 RepID=A0A4U8TLW6_9HELI|nr:AAA family ATPase [Helicobacter japonicus]TLE01284.1 AAA family ATPase [Helicobacter japonicus]